VVLDLFSGTGALGLEALSRGATRAVLVDASKEGFALSKQNAEALGFSSQVEVLPQPAARAIATLGQRGQKFTLVFMDPPYAQRAIEDLLEALVAAGVLAEGARVVTEHGKKEPVAEAVAGLTRTFARVFGDTQVSIFG
jgi:16S rRNA (guanine(966)-N(2))-methyltransferase RsmD